MLENTVLRQVIRRVRPEIEVMVQHGTDHRRKIATLMMKEFVRNMPAADEIARVARQKYSLIYCS